MARIYSIYEAKARFSEVIREVREGETVTVSYRGQPVAEIRALRQSATPTLDDRLEHLERRGALIRSARPGPDFRKVADKPGALARFLAERAQ